jgi:hypothetical protein
MKHAILAFFIIAVLSIPVLGQAGEYSRNREFGPVRLTTNEAAKLANDLLRYVQSVNDPARYSKGSAAFESGRYDATFELPMSPDDIERSPDQTFSFTVRIRSIENKINYVILALRDENRSLSVSGQSHDHVTGLLSVASDKVEAHAVRFGGGKFRVLLAIGFYLLLILGYGIVTWRFQGPKSFAVSLLVFIVLSNATIYLFPWDRIFPGTLVTRNEVGFLNTHAALFTFLGFLLGIVALGWQIILARANKAVQRIADKSGSC